MQPAVGAAVPDPRGRFEAWLVGALSVLALLPGRLVGIDRFDEGFIATGAMLIRNGAWPLRDFYSPYGPGQYAVSAVAYSLFGEDLWVSRLLDIATLGATGALLFACVRRISGPFEGRLAALAFVAVVTVARPSPNYAALTALPLLFLAAFRFGDWVERRCLRMLARASLWVGLVAAFRWDFGVYGLLALIACTGLAARPRGAGAAIGALFAATVPAFLLGVGIYALVLGDHAIRWLEEAPWFLAREFAEWRNVEFVRPAFDTLKHAVRHGPLWSAGGGALRLAFAVVPFIVLPIAAWRSIRIALRPDVRLEGSAGLALMLSLCGLCLLMQMRVRPGLGQGLPAFACALILFPWVSPCERWARHALHAGALATLALLCLAGIVTERQLWSSSGIDPAFDRATGIRVPVDAGTAEYAALLAHVRATTEPSEAIFSGVVDTSRLLVNDTMVYFLTGRRSATRFMEMEPGLSNTARGQQEIVAELERRNVRTIVLRKITSDEPNRTAVSNGITTLDDYVRRNFVATRRFADYVVMRRAEGTALR
jgi:hypothetical protein